jgi:hypothetical protein
MESIDLAQDVVRVEVSFVNAIMNLRVPHNVGNFFSGVHLAASNERLSSMKLVMM